MRQSLVASCRGALQKRQLPPRTIGPLEGARRFALAAEARGDPDPARGGLEEVAHRLRVGPLAPPAHAEARVVELSAACLADARKHPVGAERKMLAQPLLEHLGDAPRKAQEDETGPLGARLRCRLEDSGNVRVAETWD